MGKYCPIVNQTVTYQFCEDCEDKICKKGDNKMGWNSAYWLGANTKAEKAKAHHKDMLDRYNAEIGHSVAATKLWDGATVPFQMAVEKCNNSGILVGTPVVSGIKKDTVTAILGCSGKGKILALNFASFKNPGGGFLDGSSAQEEALCHESTLYEVLSSKALSGYYTENKRLNNNHLYMNRALYNPDIIFERDGAKVLADILTVASPNNRAYMQYISGAKPEHNFAALKSRIHFIGDIVRIHASDAKEKNTNELFNVILGAFGCGVFGQDPAVVAKMFKEEFKNTAINTIYAVIDKGGHSKDGAYANFKKVFTEG